MEKNIGVQNIEADGIPNIKDEEIIVTYIQVFEEILKQRKNIRKLESVEKWREEIKKSPIMLMYFQGAISQIPQKRASLQFPGKQRPGMLHGYQIDRILDLVNVIAQTPPMFILSHFCGVPINALFMDLLNTPSGNMLFSLPQVNLHLKNIFDDYGNLLKSEKSLKHFHSGKGGWLCPEALQKVNYEEVECDITAPYYGFDSWNSWFTRKFKQGRRPVQGDDNVIVNAAQNCPLTTVQIPFSNLKASDQFWLKANKYSLYDMFEAVQMGVKHIVDQSFVGGTLYQGFLSQWYYHWLHAPVSGTIIRSYRLQGGYYQQNPSLDCSQQSNLYYSQVYMSCVATRHVFIIEADNPLIGRVAMIAIGMVEVSSCISLVNDGDHVQKGMPIGRFQFGGSSHSLIFDRKANLKFNQKIFERTIEDGYEVSIRQKINTELARIVVQKNQQK